MIVRGTHQCPPQAQCAAARDVNDVLPSRDVRESEKGMRLWVELTESADVATGRCIATGVVEIDVYAWRAFQSLKSVARLTREHGRANRVAAHMAELDRRFTFQVDGGRPMRGTPEAHPEGVPRLTPDGAVQDEGPGVALLAKPIH